MRLFDYTAHLNEKGLPVLVVTIEIPLELGILAVPDEVRYFIENLIKEKAAEGKNDRVG